MANVKIVLLPVLITNYIVINIQAVNDLGPSVSPDISFAPPHPQRNFTVPDVPPVMLRFYFWESADGVAHDTLLGSADIDASLAFDAIIELWELQVDGGGDNPVDGGDTYTNPELIGADLAESGVVSTSEVGVYVVSHRGTGQKRFDELQNNPLTGGFTLFNGDKFSTGDMWFVTLYKKILAAVPPSTTSVPSDVVEKNAATVNLLQADLNKELEMTYAGTVQKIVFMDLATVTNGKYLIVNTHRFPGNYVWLDFSAGGSLYHSGKQTTYFFIPADEIVHLQVKGGVARLVHGPARLATRGDIIASQNLARRGFIQAIGTMYTKAVMPGLYQYVLDLEAGTVATFTEWAAPDAVTGYFSSRTRWALDVATESIIVPDYRLKSRRFLALVADIERVINVPGGSQVDKFKAHGHRIKAGSGGNETNPLTGPDRGIAGMDNATGGFIGTAAGSSFWVEAAGGSETRPDNVGEVPLITL